MAGQIQSLSVTSSWPGAEVLVRVLLQKSPCFCDSSEHVINNIAKIVPLKCKLDHITSLLETVQMPLNFFQIRTTCLQLF